MRHVYIVTPPSDALCRPEIEAIAQAHAPSRAHAQSRGPDIKRIIDRIEFEQAAGATLGWAGRGLFDKLGISIYFGL